MIIIDDASPDGCGRIADAFAELDERVKPVHLSFNGGLGPARNAGLARATGEHVWFVDADDVVAPGGVGHVLTRLAESDPDVLLLGHARLRVDGVVEAEEALPSLAGEGTLREAPGLLRVRQAAWNRVVRRSLLTHAGLRFPSGWYEDVPFSHLALVAAGRIAAAPEVCYHYRVRTSGSITSTPSPRHFEVFAQYESLFATLDAWGASDRLRARVFARMLEHYLVIVGNEGRVPPDLREEFFARIVEHYRRFLPPSGYPVPGGVNGVKHRFVRWHAYGAYTALRNAYRVGRPVRSGNNAASR